MNGLRAAQFMKHKLITDNNYLNIALDDLLSEFHGKNELCIIDCDSFESFSDLLNMIRKYNIKNTLKVIFIGKPGIYSSMLEGFVSFGYDLTANELREIILERKCKLANVELLVEQLISCSTFEALSQKQLQICLLCCRFKVHRVANMLKMTAKNVQQTVNISMRKMNLKSMTHLCYFMMKERGFEEV